MPLKLVWPLSGHQNSAALPSPPSLVHFLLLCHEEALMNKPTELSWAGRRLWHCQSECLWERVKESVCVLWPNFPSLTKHKAVTCGFSTLQNLTNHQSWKWMFGCLRLYLFTSELRCNHILSVCIHWDVFMIDIPDRQNTKYRQTDIKLTTHDQKSTRA